MLTGHLPNEHGIHAYSPSYSTISLEDTFIDDLDEHRSVAVNANFNLNTRQGFRDLFDQYNAISFTRFGFLDGGVDLVSFAANHDGGSSKYAKFLLKAARERSLLPSLVNGAAVKLYETGSWFPAVPRYADYGAQNVVAGAKDALSSSNSGRPVFLYANLMEAHMPHRAVASYDRSLYSTPASWSSDEVPNWEMNTASDFDQYSSYVENLRELYRASIDYLDRVIAEFLEWTEREIDTETTVIVTSDHGENLGYDYEDNLIGHAAGGLSEGLLHVPLLVFNPPDEFDLDENQPLSQLDVGELCRAIVDGSSPRLPRTEVPAERVAVPGRDTLSEELEEFEYWDRAERCVYQDDMKIVWDSLGRRRKYAVGRSPSREELVDGEDGDEPVVNDFSTPLSEYKERMNERYGTDVVLVDDTVDAGVKERLKNLGYG
ncbi:hypothetical protein GCM10009020_17390 [Natronoarchaeum mannanilyticum]|uniref:Sulfatase N-terminal domain-containing protein n=2 Tax=Natronoarchaeum mannanilyticum TaxID=926360 RepID=A0AAV3T9P6_9EURY